jgi:sn-glycerol 3-phosphate transport system substrate-binding protein
MKFSTLTVITTLLQTAVKTSGQNATNTTADGQPATLDVVNIDFMFPIVEGVTSILQETLDEMVGVFNELNPDINVNAIYSGNYDQTFKKVVARIDANDPPAVAVLNINRMIEMNDMDAIIPLNDYIKEAGGWNFLDDFFPRMLENEIIVADDEHGDRFDGSLFDPLDGTLYVPPTPLKLMGWPMMRSTPVLYYNVDMLNEAGIDPPRDWKQLIDAAKTMTTDTRKGLGIPDSWSDWIYGAFSRQAGTQVIEDRNWESVTFDSKGNTIALAIWKKLAEDGSIPVPLTPWSDAISNFLNGDFPMLYFTTGGISTIKEAGANFTWNAVYCPAGTHGFGVNQGGGDFHIFSGVPKASQDAAWKLIQFLTTPENAAQWSVASGYIAVNKKAYDTELMQAALKETPQYAVARDQLVYSHAQMMSENIDKVRQVLNDNLNALVAGNKTIAEAQAYGQAGMVAAIGAPVPTPSDDLTPSDMGGVIMSAPSSATMTGVRTGLALVLGVGGIFASLA